MCEMNPYERIIQRANNWLFSLPDTSLLRDMLKMRIAESEAEFLANFPYVPSDIERLSKLFSMDEQELIDHMRPLINKGLICEMKGKSGSKYTFADPLFMFYRMPGWKGENDVFNKELAPKLNEYYSQSMGRDFMGHPTKGLRAIPIAATVKDTRKILPYEDVLDFVDRETYHAVSTCACRHRHSLDPAYEPCEHEMGNCLHFGKLGLYTVENGMGRKIETKETLDILERSAEAGLVHGVSNTRNGVDTICNCCSCCCLFLEPFKIPTIRGHQPSSYTLEMNGETCKACGLCVKRCPMDAMEMIEERGLEAENKEILHNSELCIGCGVCVHKCPTKSLSLVERAEKPDIPESMSELGKRFLMERNRDMSKIF